MLIHVEGGFIVLNKMLKSSHLRILFFSSSFFNSGKLGIFCLEANWEYRVIRGAIRLANTLCKCTYIASHISILFSVLF